MAPSANPVARGLVDPTLREADWPRAFAARLAEEIANHRFNSDREEFQFEQADGFAIQAMLEEPVR